MILHTGKLEDESPQAPIAQETLTTPSVSMTEQLPTLRQSQIAEQVSTLTPEERMCQFRELMSDIVGQAIAQNNEELSQTIGKDVQELVLKEMNYLMREQDQAQEERYRKLDAAIRGGLRKNKVFGKEKKMPVNQ